MTDIYYAVENKLRELMSNHNVGGHGIDHMIAVMEHAKKAVLCEDLPQHTKEQIILAALLHDADDTKIFPNNKEYENARAILNETLTEEYLTSLMKDDKYQFIEDIIRLISLVSCSKNGDSDPEHAWMVIPRDCDRLEAIGEIGIQRCDEYSNATNAPDYIHSTAIVHTEEELWKVATPERFAKYKKSVSKIDHYYDKLLHIGKPECLKSKNRYILEEASRRNRIMIRYVLDFWSNMF